MQQAVEMDGTEHGHCPRSREDQWVETDGAEDGCSRSREDRGVRQAVETDGAEHGHHPRSREDRRVLQAVETDGAEDNCSQSGEGRGVQQVHSHTRTLCSSPLGRQPCLRAGVFLQRKAQ